MRIVKALLVYQYILWVSVPTCIHAYDNATIRLSERACAANFTAGHAEAGLDLIDLLPAHMAHHPDAFQAAKGLKVILVS